jgi:hypothetical protein
VATTAVSAWPPAHSMSLEIALRAASCSTSCWTSWAARPGGSPLIRRTPSRLAAPPRGSAWPTGSAFTWRQWMPTSGGSCGRRRFYGRPRRAGGGGLAQPTPGRLLQSRRTGQVALLKPARETPAARTPRRSRSRRLINCWRSSEMVPFLGSATNCRQQPRQRKLGDPDWVLPLRTTWVAPQRGQGGFGSVASDEVPVTSVNNHDLDRATTIKRRRQCDIPASRVNLDEDES